MNYLAVILYVVLILYGYGQYSFLFDSMSSDGKAISTFLGILIITVHFKD